MTKFGWTVIPHPPYSPDLAPSDFHLFGALKYAVHSVKFKTHDGVKNNKLSPSPNTISKIKNKIY
jgi:histone-lysine N-methyltransferase SETMAR